MRRVKRPAIGVLLGCVGFVLPQAKPVRSQVYGETHEDQLLPIRLVVDIASPAHQSLPANRRSERITPAQMHDRQIVPD